MQYWKASLPALVDQAIAAHDKTLGGARVCLVDFQQTTQMHPSIKESSVVGVIDHHALQSKTLTTKAAIFINIRPWGSTCTLLAEEFARTGRTPSRATAGIMLSAVLSDTLNLKGPTTTERDRRMAAQLAQQLGVTDVDALAAEQFKAKSAELATIPARELIEADMKEFSFADASGVPQRPVAIASIETTDTAPVLSRTAELQAEVRRVKEARSLDALLLVVVDIVKMQSSVILAGLPPLLRLLPLPPLPLPPSAAASLNSNERSPPQLIADHDQSYPPSPPAPRVSIPLPPRPFATRTDAHDTALAKMAFPDGRTMPQEVCASGGVCSVSILLDSSCEYHAPARSFTFKRGTRAHTHARARTHTRVRARTHTHMCVF
jgi:manganese-dependent inorganic pyrophosphatase